MWIHDVVADPMVRVAIISGVLLAYAVWPTAVAQERIPILRCFHGGETVAAVPVPAPPDFRVQMSAGSVTSAEWTLDTGQKVVMAATAPCVYLVTQPRPGERGAE